MVSLFGPLAILHISLWQRKQIASLLLDLEFSKNRILCPACIFLSPPPSTEPDEIVPHVD